MNELVFKNEDGKPVTNSILVAEKFEKRHSDVIRAIENVISLSTEIQSKRNFALSDYMDATGKSNPLYILTRDGFSAVALGFTGEKAIKFRWDFIDQFNRMEEMQKAIEDGQRTQDAQSAKRRWHLTTEKRTLDARIESDMQRRRQINRELNQINFEDFQRANFELFDKEEGRIPGLFPNKSKLLKIS